jgi:hypothetical protein
MSSDSALYSGRSSPASARNLLSFSGYKNKPDKEGGNSYVAESLREHVPLKRQ